MVYSVNKIFIPQLKKKRKVSHWTEWLLIFKRPNSNLLSYNLLSGSLSRNLFCMSVWLSDNPAETVFKADLAATSKVFPACQVFPLSLSK